MMLLLLLTTAVGLSAASVAVSASATLTNGKHTPPSSPGDRRHAQSSFVESMESVKCKGDADERR